MNTQRVANITIDFRAIQLPGKYRAVLTIADATTVRTGDADALISWILSVRESATEHGVRLMLDDKTGDFITSHDVTGEFVTLWEATTQPA